MKSLDLFKPEEVRNLEDYLFSQDNVSGVPVRYALINTHLRYYYWGVTSNAAAMISRLRAVVLKADYKLMAHFLQKAASTTQMSDWTLAIFKDGVEQHTVRTRLKDFELIRRANPFEVVNKEDTRCYKAYNRDYGHTVYFSTARPDVTVSSTMGNIKRLCRSQVTYLQSINRTSPSDKLAQMIKVAQNTADHTYAQQWNLTMVPDIKGYEQSREHCHLMNYAGMIADV